MRDKGDGWIGKRKVNGKVVGFMATFELSRRSDGSRQRKAVYGKTRDEVKAKLKAAQAKQEATPGLVDSKMSVERFLERWLEQIKPPKAKIRLRTWVGYRDHVHNHLIPELGQIPLAELRVTHVNDMLGRLLDGSPRHPKPLSGRTVHKIRAVLWTALNSGVDEELITRNVAASSRPPDIKETEFEVFTPEQADRFEEAIKGDPEEALYLLALDSGWRQGEILGLRWSDVDLKTGKIWAVEDLEPLRPDERRKKDERYRLDELKTKRSKRPCVLGPAAAEALREHRKMQVSRQVELGGRWLNKWDLVFTTEYGAPIDHTALTRRFQKSLKEAGLPRLRFNDLRHSAAVFMLRGGLTVNQVAGALGHTSPAQVIARYGNHVPDTTPDDAAAAMARARGRAV